MITALTQPAAPGLATPEPPGRVRLLICAVGHESYAADVASIRFVLPADQLIALADGTYRVCAEVAFRGRRVPVVRLHDLFGVRYRGDGGVGRVLVTTGGRWPVGLLVDAVERVLEVRPAAIRPIPERVTMLEGGYFRGLVVDGERVILVLAEAHLAAMDEVALFYRSTG
jgi:chemotaxis signal transduction protein